MDFTAVFIWWLYLLLFGLVGWPLAFSLLRHLPDHGFAFIRPMGFLVTGYILWLGATFRLLQNSLGGVLVAMLLVLAIGFLWQRQLGRDRQTPSILDWLKQEWRYAVTIEVLFTIAFVGWTIFKAYNPNIETAGGEKWMEIAFINGILRSDSFPPQDPWLSGFGISYYYFGYVMMAQITQLAGIVSTTAFNFYIPTLFAMTLTAALGVVANLTALYQKSNVEIEPEETEKSGASSRLNIAAIATGLVGALFVGVMSNLIGVLEVLHKRGLLPPEFWTWLDIRDLNTPPAGPGDSWIPDRFIWWWRGSRVLTDYNLAGREQEVIDEFPFFSFLLGDVHPHVLALPFVLLVTGLALNLLINPEQQKEAVKNPPDLMIDKAKAVFSDVWQQSLMAMGGRFGFLFYAICIGSLSFLNTWDFPIYLSVVGLAFILWLRQYYNWQRALRIGVIGVGMLAVASIILYFPFYATFQSQARGLLPNLWNPTRLPQFVVFFGPFLFAVIALSLVLSSKYKGWRNQAKWTIPLTILGPILLMFVALTAILISPTGRDYVEGIINNPEIQATIGEASVGALIQNSLWRRILNPWTFLFLGGLLGWALALVVGLVPSQRQSTHKPADQRNRLAEQFVLILLIIGIGLPLTVEFVYLRDNFGIRMNTIFKFYFQAWVLLALTSAFAVHYVSRNLRGLPALAWKAAMVVLVAGGMVYTVLATANKTDNFQGEPTLNGISWISRQYPGDYAAINWLHENVAENAVILEAPGSGYAAYQYTGRISALTGIPTVLGWGGHQSQWRGNYDEPARREPDIDLIYNTADPIQAQSLLEEYNIDYVYIGALERDRYSPQGLNKFDQMLEVVFQQDEVTIYQVN